MRYVDLIDKTIEKIRGKGYDFNIDTENKNSRFEKYYDELNKTAGIVFSEDIKDIYRKSSISRIRWADSTERVYGCFDLIPIEDILSLHNDMVEAAESAAKYAVTEREKANISKLDIVNNMYPIFDFSSGDKLCIESSTGKIVFYDYSVNELGDIDINGLVIAESYDKLIEKWSSILFLEGFWWLTEYDRCVNSEGINLNNEYLKNFV